jgi:hypothetical protein
MLWCNFGSLHHKIYEVMTADSINTYIINFLYCNQLDALISQIYFAIKLYMFRTVPLSIIRNYSLYTQQWYMSCRFVDSFRAAAGSGWNSMLILLESCLQTCMTYTIAEYTVLMMDRGTVRNMLSFIPK